MNMQIGDMGMAKKKTRKQFEQQKRASSKKKGITYTNDSINSFYRLTDDMVATISSATRTGKMKWVLKYKGYDKVRYCSELGPIFVEIIKQRYLDKETLCSSYHYSIIATESGRSYRRNNVSMLFDLVQKHATSLKQNVDDRDKEVLDKFDTLNMIGKADVIVRNNSFKCYKRHEVKDVGAVVTVGNKNGNVIYVPIIATYCKQCRTYFISDDTYRQVKLRGIILHKVIDVTTYKSGELGRNNLWGELQAESILHQLGYNVGKTDNLSDEQIWAILEMAVNSGIVTRGKIIDHLNYCINMRESNPTMVDAISKWVLDKQHIANYQINKLSKVDIQNIFVNHTIIF